jgi:hypothetical protein
MGNPPPPPPTIDAHTLLWRHFGVMWVEGDWC